LESEPLFHLISCYGQELSILSEAEQTQITPQPEILMYVAAASKSGERTHTFSHKAAITGELSVGEKQYF
jgi:hypothetical protein